MFLHRVKQAAQDVDFVALQRGAAEQAAEFGEQAFGLLRVEKAGADHHRFEVRVEAFNIVMTGRG